jgi:hypothetical protein
MQAERHRLRLEHDEAERLLDQQRALIRDLERLRSSGPAADVTDNDLTAAVSAEREPSFKSMIPAEEVTWPPTLAANYRELLRAYVIMGSGNLAREMGQFADSLAEAGVSAPQTVELHVRILEEAVRGLGNRSARHVMSRADLLVLEVIVHLAEGYRRRLDELQQPLEQKLLPGFFERTKAEVSSPPLTPRPAGL